MRVSVLIFILVSSVSACGDDERPGGARAPAEALDPVPRAWGATNRLGYALLNVPAKDPLTLNTPTCTVDAQLVTADMDGVLAETDRNGVCAVTRDYDWLGVAMQFTPECAGVITFNYGMVQRSVLCDRIPSAIEVDCGAASSTASFTVASAPMEMDGDVLGELTSTVLDPGVPTITLPVPAGDGTAVWPVSGDLELAWETSMADAVEIVIGQTSGSGPQVRCWAADVGSFTVPAALIDAYRSGTTFIEVAAVNQERTEPDGFAYRASFRKSDAIWLFPAAGT